MIASLMAEIFNFLSFLRERRKKKKRKELKKFQNLRFGNLVNKFSPELFELIVEE